MKAFKFERKYWKRSIILPKLNEIKVNSIVQKPSMAYWHCFENTIGPQIAETLTLLVRI